MTLLLVLVFALAACASDAPEGVAVHRQVRGDTLVLTSLGRGATMTADRVLATGEIVVGAVEI